MKYPPNASILRAIAAGRVGWLTAMGEWIDNSFDRYATRVALTFEKDSLTIEDDGEGTPTPHKIVQLGEHTRASDGLGEFGMGGKESLLWAGGERSAVTIVTTYKRVTRRLSMNWSHFAQSGWDLPDASERPSDAPEIGTRITVKPLQAKLPRNPDAICAELGYLYSRAIRHYQKQITVRFPNEKRPRVIVPWEPPPWNNALPQVRGVAVSVGQKEAVVYAGVVQDGQRNTKSGLTYYYKYRVILEASARGCGNFHMHHVCGFVELRDGWKSSLTRNKNGLTVDDDALFVEVEKVIKLVLEAGERVGSTFQLRDLSTRLESRIGAMLRSSRDSKAKRELGDQHGSVKPAGTDRKHTQAREEQPGVTFPGTHNGRGLKIGYEHLGGTKIGEAKPPNITLNLDNQFIGQAVSTGDENTLISLIAGLIADYDVYQSNNGEQRYLRGMEPKTFSEQAGTILSKSPTLDGRPALKVISA